MKGEGESKGKGELNCVCRLKKVGTEILGRILHAVQDDGRAGEKDKNRDEDEGGTINVKVKVKVTGKPDGVWLRVSGLNSSLLIPNYQLSPAPSSQSS